ncbi:MAG: biotin--[acetyl-CoA-carboxylase] ligase [Gemmatimonadaceae bacterium]|nr:biotin--[acetyl-CoA-carboxylase] ligase [Gemmatimonadaceae bacterium]
MMSHGTELSRYDDTPCDIVRMRAGASHVLAVEQCTSTMDLAHELAADGASHGTVVVADEQGSGRGRTGKSWVSGRGAGVWASVVLRQRGDAPAGVLSLRVGLQLAQALDARVATTVQLKWPNDLFLDGRKLGGVLTEARWRGDLLEWIVVGVGVNVRDAGVAPPVAALGEAVRRADVLVDVIHAILTAAESSGELSANELMQFAQRDLARGRTVTAPLEGTVLGITPRGGVQIRTHAGDAVAMAGSLVFRTSHRD